MSDKVVGFSQTVLALWDAFEAATDPDEKRGLALQLAEEFCEDRDDLDPSFPLQICRLCDELELARLNFGLAGSRLAMTLIELLRNTHATAKQRETAN